MQSKFIVLNLFIASQCYGTSAEPIPASVEQQAHYTTIAQKLSPDAQHAFRFLVDTERPTAERCRPSIRAGVAGIADSNLSHPTRNAEAVMSCIVAGYKNVCIAEKNIADRLLNIKGMKQLFAELQLQYISDPKNRLSKFIFFTPDGKTDALLLYKYSLLESAYLNHYLIGSLLGYPAEDIKAFYNYSSSSEELRAALPFYSDKEAALAWIKANSPDIEQWFEKHREAAKSTILFHEYKNE